MKPQLLGFFFFHQHKEGHKKHKGNAKSQERRLALYGNPCPLWKSYFNMPYTWGFIFLCSPSHFPSLSSDQVSLHWQQNSRGSILACETGVELTASDAYKKPFCP